VLRNANWRRDGRGILGLSGNALTTKERLGEGHFWGGEIVSYGPNRVWPDTGNNQREQENSRFISAQNQAFVRNNGKNTAKVKADTHKPKMQSQTGVGKVPGRELMPGWPQRGGVPSKGVWNRGKGGWYGKKSPPQRPLKKSHNKTKGKGSNEESPWGVGQVHVELPQ